MPGSRNRDIEHAAQVVLGRLVGDEETTLRIIRDHPECADAIIGLAVAFAIGLAEAIGQDPVDILDTVMLEASRYTEEEV